MKETTDSLWNGSSPRPASEDDILALVDAFFPSRSKHVPFGRGHDCAELAGLGTGIALSTDLFMEHRHFRRAYCTPEEVGAKALAAAVSDLAAAGAEPLGFSLGLILPPEMGVQPLSGIFEGMARKAEQCHIVLTGGDISKGDSLGFSVTVWGRSAVPDMMPVDAGGPPPFLRRNRPEQGDILFLLGTCGLAGVGLSILEERGRSGREHYPLSTKAFLDPNPLLDHGRTLVGRAAEYCRSRGTSLQRFSLMDVSDGLLRDLPRLLGNSGAELLDYREVIDQAEDSLQQAYGELAAYAKEKEIAAERLFFTGGEDYALLGSCPPDFWETLTQNALPAYRLGRVQGPVAILYHGAQLSALFGTGFDHFSPTAGGGVPFDPVCAGGHGDQAPPVYSSIPADPAYSTNSAYPACPTNSANSAYSTNSACPTGKAAHDEHGDTVHPDEEAALPSTEKAVSDIAACCREAWCAGLMAGFNGNVSCRITPPMGRDTPERAASSGGSCLESFCVITRSGAAKARLCDSDFAILSLPSGRELWGGKASTEKAVHTAIYASCPGSFCIMHTHPPKLTALSLITGPERFLHLPLPEAETYRTKLAWAAFSPPGTKELAVSVAQAAQQAPAVWMERHGLVVHAKNLGDALSLTEELEQLAAVQLLSISAAR